MISYLYITKIYANSTFPLIHLTNTHRALQTTWERN